MRRKTKNKWVYQMPSMLTIEDVNKRRPPLPNQARNIAKILLEAGALKRPALLEAMQTLVKTKQKGGANRILTYYQKLLIDAGFLILTKRPENG